MTLIRTLELDYDLIEIHYNPNLSKRQYLVRIFSYSQTDPQEIRLDEKDMDSLYQIMKEHKLL